MSCSGCRVLRKGCSEKCVLRTCLQWIPTPEGQGNATLFLSRFFGRSDLLSLVAAVPEPQRPALFQSLLFEACGRTVNPVDGAVGLLSTGNWHVCQAAVDTLLSGGALQRLPGFLHSARLDDEFSTNTGTSPQVDPNFNLTNNLSPNLSGKRRGKRSHFMENYWPTKTMSSLSSEESKAVAAESGGGGTKLLNLFV